MTDLRRSAADAGRAIADALAARHIPYAIGGALALGVAGVPRGTKDVDVNVFSATEALPDVFDTLIELGIHVDREAALARAKRDGMFVGDWDGMRVDVFVPSIPFSDEAERTRVNVTIDGWTGISATSRSSWPFGAMRSIATTSVAGSSR